MKNKIIIRILIICIVLLVIGLIAACVLYFTTDMLKPASNVFKKYSEQNMKQIYKIVNLSAEDNHINILKQKNYSDNTNIKLLYRNTQGGVEQFDGTVVGNTDNTGKNTYRNINIKSGENNNVINAEFIKENQIYGILFSDIVKNHVSIDANNMEILLNKLNIDSTRFDKYKILNILGTIDEKMKKIENTYISFIKNLSGKQFKAQKNKLITLSNSESVTTDAYSLKLTSEQTKKLYINILKDLEKGDLIESINNSEEQIPELSVEMYISNKKTVRVDLEYGNISTRLDFYDNEINIKYNKVNEEQTETIDVNVKNENGTKYIEYDNQINKMLLQVQAKQNENNSTATLKFDIKNEKIQALEVQLNQNIEVVDSVDTEKKFDSRTNAILNEFDISTLNRAINSLLQRIKINLQETNNSVKSEILNMFINKINQVENDYIKWQEQEKQTFNNQFLAYKGKELDINVLYNMLDYAGRNMKSYNLYGDYIKIYLEQGTENMRMAEELKEKVKSVKGKYNISFQYNSEGKISVILMEKSTKKR